MEYGEICARGNAPIYCNKATGIGMRNLAVTGVIVTHPVIVI